MTQAGAELEWQAIVKMSISLGNQTIISGTKLQNPAISTIQNIYFCNFRENRMSGLHNLKLYSAPDDCPGI